MGTITTRRRKDGTTGYTAQIRLKRSGTLLHTESATFDRRAPAAEWMRRREAELDQQRARGEPFATRQTLADLIDWYKRDIKKHASWGRTKEADLDRLARCPIANKQASSLTTRDFIEHAEQRREGGAGAATVGNDLIWLRQVLKAARASQKASVNVQAIDDAALELRTRRVTAKAKERKRRLEGDEENRLMERFRALDGRARIPMSEVVAFAILSARRQEEITRLRWVDLDEARGIAWLDDVKHPRHKIGNRRAFRMLSEAWEIVKRQPRTSEFVFPYNPKSIGTAFHRACRLLRIENLHFHDLRHEATSRFFERGYGIHEVAQFTLHESWQTLKRYTHLKPQDIVERERKLPAH